MSAHTCHAVGCETTCAPKFLMCPRHWRMVPKVLQEAVWVTYRPGQERGGALPSRNWFAAARAAQVAVGDLEGRTDVPTGYRTTGAPYLALLETTP